MIGINRARLMQIKKRPLPFADDIAPIYNLGSFLLQAKVQFQQKWNSKSIPHATVNDFEWYRTLGKGSFGRVILARHKLSRAYCAVKVLDKNSIIKRQQLKHAYFEMKVLTSVSFPFLVYMVFAMQDNSFLYFVLPFVVGGELFSHLRNSGRFSEDMSKFYAAQVCLGLEYLHFLDILYRDLKPENILIDHRGYLKITDMGFCKIVKGRTYTFCGTPEYLAPEVLFNKGYGKAVDWWSYGILLFEMNAGYPPFLAHGPMKIYERIAAGKYKHAIHFSRNLKHLISNILQVDPTKRYGNLVNGVNDIKNHKWFRKTKWLDILNYNEYAPYLPEYAHSADSNNFDNVVDEPLISAPEDRYRKEFENF